MSIITKRNGSIAAACVLVVLLLALVAGTAMGASAYYWTTIRDGANGNLNALTATDADHVWGVASNNPPTGTVIFSSANASGATPTWTEQTVSTVYLSGISALDNTHVWASGGNAGGTGDNTSAIYCWNSTGGTWDRQNNGGTAYQFNGATALSSTQAWVCGNDAGTPNKGRILWSNGGAYNSGTGGTAWIDDFVDPTTNGCPIKNVSAAGSSVWAVGYEATTNDGKIFKRTGPNNWTLQKTVTGWRLYGIKALDDNHAWAAGRNGTVLYTSDGGTTWDTATTPGITDMSTITATDMNNVWVGGSTGIIWTWNGSTWGTNTVPLGTDSVKGSASPDAGHVYMGSGASTRNRVFRGALTSIASCNPTWGAQGQTIDVVITGADTHFQNGVSAATFSGTGITVNSTTVTGATLATANITIDAGAAAGLRDINVTTGAELPNPLAGGFRVKAMHTITVNAGANGTIAPAGPVKVVDGENQAFTITPAAGYHTVDVTVDGVHLGSVTNYKFKNVKSDHVIAAVFSNKYPTWYLPEGSTAWGFGAAINIENPNDADLTAKVTYMMKDGKTKEQSVALPKLSKVTVSPADTIGNTDFSTKVECVQGKTIAVDRTMEWQSGQGQAAAMTNSIGVTAPSTNWYLPEGSSNWGLETWLLIQNPNDVEASCDVTYMIEGVGPKTINHKVPAFSRATFNMVDEIGNADASIQLSSNIGVIPERALYTPWPGAGRGASSSREGHDSIGATNPANDFYLAEGTTAWGFTTYVLVQNPNATAADVTLTFMTNEGPLEDMDFTMPAKSRKTVRVNDAYPNKDLSTKVHADKPIVAERSMFWSRPDVAGLATHDSIGTGAAHMTWYLPDGFVTPENGEYETFTLVQNPNAMDVKIKVSYLSEGGGSNVVFTDTVKANSRKTYDMSASFDEGTASASILVESQTAGKKIIVERAMYSSGRSGGSDTIGGFSD